MKPEKDIFNTRWVIIGVIVTSLVMPIVSSCGVKGELHHPRPVAQTPDQPASPMPQESAQPNQPQPVQ